MPKDYQASGKFPDLKAWVKGGYLVTCRADYIGK